MYIGTTYGRILELKTEDFKLNFTKKNINGSPVTDIAFNLNKLFIGYKNG